MWESGLITGQYQWTCSHLSGSALQDQQLLDDDWLMDSSQQVSEGVLTGLPVLWTQILHRR